MGNLLHKLSKPIRDFNIENRAHRIISRDKPKPAPKYKTTELELERVLKENPGIVEELAKKHDALDGHLKEVFVTSNDFNPEIVQNPDKPLPLNRKPVIEFDYGVQEPKVIRDGFASLRQVMEFINGHFVEPDKCTPLYVAAKYKINLDTATNILKYYKAFEVFFPEKTINARFARPAGWKEIE